MFSGCLLAIFVLASSFAFVQSLPKDDTKTPASSASSPGPKASLEASETFFSLLAALNSCGYDQELGISDPIRQKIRADLNQTVQILPQAARAHAQFCSFYRDHRESDPGRDLSRFVSLALNVSDPPIFATTIKEADLPPDSQPVLGVIPVLQRLYDAANMHNLWKKYEPEYDRYIARLHDPLAETIQRTDLYLKNPISGYGRQKFTVILEPQIAPGQVNARNYVINYYIVVAPAGDDMKLDQIRHTYLHYVLDPYLARRAKTLKKLEPIAETLSRAPLDDIFKNDMGLLVLESLIKAVEARTMSISFPSTVAKDGKEREKAAEAARSASMQRSVEQGFVLTRYFYESLVQFEKQPESFQQVFLDMLFGLDVDREKKRASEVRFSKETSSELVHRASLHKADPLDLAEEHLAKGESEAAQRIAQEVLDENSADPGRAMFIIARAATLNKDMEGARTYFERTLQIAREPRIVAWSHIYLARIFDIQQNRQNALMHYNAALNAGDVTPDTKTAAERGIEKPYQVPLKKPQ